MSRRNDAAPSRAPVLPSDLVLCSLSTNNVLNPFTPFGDCSLIRMANLYCNIAQLGGRRQMAEALEMVTTRSARLMNRRDYGIATGHPADLVVLDAADPSWPWPNMPNP